MDGGHLAQGPWVTSSTCQPVMLLYSWEMRLMPVKMTSLYLGHVWFIDFTWFEVMRKKNENLFKLFLKILIFFIF